MNYQFESAPGYSQNWYESISSIKPPITTHQVVTIDDLAKELLACANEQFTGRLDIETPQDQQWNFYFFNGSICGGSGVHPMRSWHRQISRHCPQLLVDAAMQKLNQPQDWNYDALAKLVKQGKVPQEQMAVVVESYILDILFDIIQLLEQPCSPSLLRINYSHIPQDIINSALVVVPADQAWQQALHRWESWQVADLLEISPNLAPTIVKAEELERQTLPLVYRNLTSLMEGNLTFRDIAAKWNRNLLLLTKPMLPYIRQGLIKLIEIEDLSFVLEPPTVHNTEEPNNQELEETDTSSVAKSPAKWTPSSGPLIACIDDSSIDLLVLNQVLTQAGYRFINIRDQHAALSTLMSQKPDLIFLDLVMPIANGYEICAQIRRVPFFKDTPVIILTGKDGIIDRTRAKMVGSSDFLTKPINRETVLNILKTHLSTPTLSQSQAGDKVMNWLTEQQIHSSPI